MNRKISILDSGAFPILKVENFLSDTEYKEIQDEVKKEVSILDGLLDKGMVADRRYSINGKDFARVNLDFKYLKDRTESRILTIMEDNLFSNEMIDIYDNMSETAFKLIKASINHETLLTVYRDKSIYNWHNDTGGGRVANFVLLIDMGMKFKGGHTQISNVEYNSLGERTLFEGGLDLDADIDIEPKGNQLIIMPMWVTHRVTPIKMELDNLIDGRITVNGHIGFTREEAPNIRIEKKETT